MQLTIASAGEDDSAARALRTAAGLKVEIWDTTPGAAQRARTPEDFAAALRFLADTRNLRTTELFLCNTLLTWWAVHLAAHLGKPSALYLHESSPVKRFFQTTLPPALHEVAEEALRLATRVVFTAKSTRDIHEELNLNDNFRSLASWVDFARIEQFVAANWTSLALRRKPSASTPRR